MGDEKLSCRSCSVYDIAAADRTRRKVGRRTIGGRARSLKLRGWLEGVGLWRPSLLLTGNFLELRRIGTGNGGAMLEAPLTLPLSMLGSLGLRGRIF